MFDQETEEKIEQLADEIFEGVAEDRDIVYFEGGIVRSAPTGAPPEYITVEVEAIYDENVMWRGIPASLIVGDEVLVWENPKTHRREIAGGSGATTTSTASPWQKINVAVSGGDFALLSAAIAWINALPGAIGPSAVRLFAINMLGGTFVEAANVTVPQYVGVEAEGEETVLDMGNFALIMSDDTSLESIVVTSTGTDQGWVLDVNGDNVVLRDIRVIVTSGVTCLHIASNDYLAAYHVICEATTSGCQGVYFDDSVGSLLWDCEADHTNFDIALYIDNNVDMADVTTKFCEWTGHNKTNADGDVVVVAGSTWRHFCCQFDPTNSTINGTELPQPHGRTYIYDVTRIGNPGVGNYSEFEADGTVEFIGTATVWNDIYFPMSSGKVGGANQPTWAAFQGNTMEYTFAINDYIHLPSGEIAHSYKEGTDIKLHVHIVLDGSDVGNTDVNYEIEYTIGDMNEVMSAAAIVTSGDYTILGGTADRMHLFIQVGTIVGATYLIGAALKMRFRRIALVGGGNAPSNDPFVLMVGAHIEEDTVGSRTELTK